jgi:hypothetical protein
VDVVGEFMSLGDAKRKLPAHQVTYKVMSEALENFKQALQHSRKVQGTTAKERARLYQKLMETSIKSSILAPEPVVRKKHAEQAIKYGEASLIASRDSGDNCMVSQVEFMLACAAVWNLHLQPNVNRSSDEESKARLELQDSFEKLKRYRKLEIRVYEEQMKVYLEYLSDQERK